MRWRTATSALELIRFTAGKVAVAETGTGPFASAAEVQFSDGTAIRITAEGGTVYSLDTIDNATILLELGEP